MIVLQINTTVNTGSTGRIAEDIGQVLIDNGHKSYIAYGRGNFSSKSNLIKIGTQKDVYFHGVKTALFDRHSFGSKKVTQELINKIDSIKPDVIGLHNLHGYYINIEVLFTYLSKIDIPIFWTLFDCWAFTGHCTYFDDINCKKWETQCNTCQKTNKYPSSYWLDNSKKNYRDKKKLFNLPQKLELIVHSKWLKKLVQKSFLKTKPIHHIFSGVDLMKFTVKPFEINTKEKVLGVASTWDLRKGLNDFIKLSKLLDPSYQVVLIGLSKHQIKTLPNNIMGIERTENIEELAQWYSDATVFVNPTYQDNFPTTNLEALACGTPIITYNTGGSPEAIDEKTGFVIKKGDVYGIVNAIKKISKLEKEEFSINCRKRAMELFNKEDRYNDYIKLYEKKINE